MEKEILMEYADMKVEAKDLRRRIEKDRSQLWKLENLSLIHISLRGAREEIGQKENRPWKITGAASGRLVE